MLVLHIGPHKTATTYIQQNLFANHLAFAQKGWIYPELGIVGVSGHHDIASDLESYISGDKAEALAAVGRKAAETGSNIVLSAEGFCRWKPEKFKALATVLGQEEVELVYTIRDPFDILYSYWGEEVKQGYSASFSDRFLENLTSGTRSRLLNPMRDLSAHLATPWAKVSAVPYNALIADGIDLYDHFCSTFLHVTDVPKVDERPKNKANAIELTEFLRLLTTVHGGGAAYIGSDLRHKFMEITSAKDRSELVDLLRNLGGRARRKIEMEGADTLKRRLENVVLKGLAGHWSYPVEGRSIYNTNKQEFAYYDAFILWQIDPIREAVIKMRDRLS